MIYKYEYYELQKYLINKGFYWLGFSGNRANSYYPVCIFISLNYKRLTYIQRDFVYIQKYITTKFDTDNTLYKFNNPIYKSIIEYGIKEPSYIPRKKLNQ